jgi:PAS domain S-box-containing protein
MRKISESNEKTMLKDKILDHLKIPKNIIPIGIMLAAFYWLFEALIHTYIRRESAFITQLFPADIYDAGMRLFVAAIIICFSIYVQWVIDKLKKEENVNRFTREELDQIFETAADGMRVVDKDFNVLRVNETFSILSGVSKEEAVGQKCYDVFGGPLCETLGCPLKQILNGEKRVEFDIEKRRKNGTGIYCTLTAVPLKGNGGEPIGIVENFKDISEYEIAREALKESEERYRNLQKNIPLGIFRSAPGGRIIAANPAMVKMFGCSSEEEILTTPAVDLYIDPERRQNLLDILKIKGIVSGFEAQLRRKDGSIFWSSLNIKGVTDKSEKVMYHDGIIEDISRHKKMEEELIKSEKLESLGLLAGGIAHDINNILASILVNIGLTKMIIKKEEIAISKLTQTEKAVMRAKALTQQLLTFSSGGAPIKGPASITGLLRDTANFVLSGSRVKCKCTFSDNLRDTEIDEGQISQVIQNLVINAAQAMPGGGLVHILADNITVGPDNHGLHLPLKEGKYIKIIVNDQGRGIPTEHIDKIFDPFFTTKEKQSGLGLSIAYSIIKKHNGLITVESKLEMGTTFYIYLPTSGEKIKNRVEKVQPAYAGQGKVLLMDDEALILESTSDLLHEIGYTVEVAKNGDEALKLYEEARQSGFPFDVVVLDLIIPGGMGGQETIRELRRLDPEVRAVVSSGYSTDPVLAKHKEYGFVCALSKPYRMGDLNSVLEEAVS